MKGKFLGNDWRSNEYEQFSIVDNNASGDTAFTPQEGEDSVLMDTAIIILAPDVALGGLIKDAESAIAKVDEKLAEVDSTVGEAVRKADAATGLWSLPLMVGRELYQWRRYHLPRFEWEDVVRYAVVIIVGCVVRFLSTR